jgi:hypothetical protein
MNAESAIQKIFDLSTKVRYTAIYNGEQLTSRMREEAFQASQSESDRYEELLVNPALLTLVKQRGNIDCGGAQFVVVRYGNFYQLILDLPNGHVSVCFELNANPLEYAEAIRMICS